MTTPMNRIVSQRYGRLLTLCVGLAILLPAVASAQSVWLDPDRPQSISIEVFKPDFNNLNDNTFFSGAYVVSGRMALTPSLNLAADIPLSHYGIDGGGINVSETAVGNPYLGVELWAPNRLLYGEFGVRLPIDGNEDALLSGFASDLDRREAFFGDVFSIIGQVNYRYRIPAGLSKFSLRLRGGPNFWIYADEDATDDVDLFANYAAQLWYHANYVQVGVGAIGRALLTEGNLSFGERTAHQLDVSVLGMYRGVQPGVHFGLPFDDNDFGDVVDYVVGFSLTVPVR